MGCQKNRPWPRFRGSARRRSASSAATRRQRSASRRKQLASLQQSGVIAREFADTYRMTAVPRTGEQRLRCALRVGRCGLGRRGSLGRRALRLRGRAGHASGDRRSRCSRCPVDPGRDPPGHRSRGADVAPQRGIPTTGVEATLLALAAALDDEPFEIACEDARRRRLVSIPSLRAYLDQWGRAGRPGVTALRRHLRVLDPIHRVAVDVGGEDSAAARHARSRQLLPRVSPRVAGPYLPVRLRVSPAANDPRDERAKVARRRDRLRVRQREVECPRPARISDRAGHLGQGHGASGRPDRRARDDAGP